MQLYYQPQVSETGFLSEEESKHLVKVLRQQQGDSLQLTNGKGQLYQARIATADVRKCAYIVTETTFYEPDASILHLAIAPTKNADRMEWLVEKAVETGVGQITLIQTARTERSFIKKDRLEKIAISAMKQSKRYYLPVIEVDVKFGAFLANENLPAQKLIAHLAEGERHTLQASLMPGNAVVLIGPEGDFTPAEVEAAFNKGFKPVTLGNSILRTETAGLYAAAAFRFVNNL